MKRVSVVSRKLLVSASNTVSYGTSLLSPATGRLCMRRRNYSRSARPLQVALRLKVQLLLNMGAYVIWGYCYIRVTEARSYRTLAEKDDEDG